MPGAVGFAVARVADGLGVGRAAAVAGVLDGAGWPAEPDPDLLWLKPHLARLRSKLEAVGGPRIVAVRSVGYRIEADEPA